MDIWIQESQPRNMTIKDKERLKAVRKKWLDIYTGSSIRLSVDFSAETVDFCKPENRGITFKVLKEKNLSTENIISSKTYLLPK